MVLFLIINNIKKYFYSGYFFQLIIYNILMLVLINFNLNINKTYHIFWLLILYSILLSIDNLFQKDYSDNSLEIIFISDLSLYFYTLFKFTLFWIFCQFPFFMILFFFYAFDHHIFLSLFLGSLSFTLIGGLNNALTLYLQDKSIIISIMVYPLFIPIIIYGTSLYLFILIIIFVFLIIIIPFLTSRILIHNIK